MPPRSRKEVGDWGERIAQSFLRGQGYHILETNYRCPHGEADIVAQDGECLVFVEVKTRRSRSYGAPEESITPVKEARMSAVADHYLQSRDITPDQYRIDLITVEVESPGRAPKVRLIKNATLG
ncbi:MAG: hypothetical protein HW403_1339 [Dehalococcoidia bacterium]|nr:hypothetical protein [Dehalococcoidia bacterium]